jgi:hypothetical protein
MTIKISQLANLTVVQANTIVPVVSNVTGTLTTVQANVQQIQDYIVANGVSANITALYTNAATQSDLIIGINANVTLANLNLKTYVDGQITAANAGVTASNIGIIGYIGLGNTTMKSYVDGQITSANAGVSLSNTSMKSYVDGQITSANAGVSLSNTSMKSYVDGQITSANAGVVTANIAMKGYVDNQTYSNVNVLTYLETTFDGNISGNVGFLDRLTFANVYTPTLSNAQGISGQITWDNSYIYICVGTNAWKRANISTW